MLRVTTSKLYITSLSRGSKLVHLLESYASIFFQNSFRSCSVRRAGKFSKPTSKSLLRYSVQILYFVDPDLSAIFKQFFPRYRRFGSDICGNKGEDARKSREGR